MNTLCRLSGILLAFAALPLLAEEVETEWIEPVEGFEEKNVGARVITIESIPVTGRKRVTIAIPKEAMPEAAQGMEEIVVVGRQPDEKEERRIEVRHQWVADYEDDYYGLILQFGGEDNIPFRLYLKSD